MRFSLVATVFIPVLSAAADNILVAVGANNQLAFSPSNVTANVGDTITFQFQSKNHSVTQSTFPSPCQIQTTPAQGIDSGFQFVAPGSNELPEWSFTLNNASAPLWFFCAQTIPADHCQMGMVFSVNANPNSAKSFAVYQQNAMSSGGAAPPSGGAPPSGAESIAASIGGDVTSDAASFGSEATSFGGSVLGDATSAAGAFGSQATSVGGSIIGDATGAAGNEFSSFFGNSGPSSTSSAAGSNSTQTGAGFRLERSVSLPVLAAVGLAGVLLL